MWGIVSFQTVPMYSYATPTTTMATDVIRTKSGNQPTGCQVGGSSPDSTPQSSAGSSGSHRNKQLLKSYHDFTMQLFTGNQAHGETDALFVAAVRSGDYERVENLLRRRSHEVVNIDARDQETGDTALMIAVRSGHTKIVRLLLKYGADVTLQNGNGKTALDVTTDRDLRKILVESVFRSGASHRHLLQAAWQGNIKVVRKLLGENKILDINCRNADGFTPLLLVTRDVELFESIGAALESYDPLAVIDELLRYRADPVTPDPEGYTPLHYAASGNAPLSDQLAMRLMKFPGARESLDGRSQAPIHVASQSGSVDVVVALLDEGVDVNARGHSGSTPLHVSASAGQSQVANTLLHHGADITLVDDKGNTPVDVAKTKRLKSALREAWADATDSKQDPVLSPVKPPSRMENPADCSPREGRFDTLTPLSTLGDTHGRRMLQKFTDAQKAVLAEEQMLKDIETGRFTPGLHYRKLGLLQRNAPSPNKAPAPPRTPRVLDPLSNPGKVKPEASKKPRRSMTFTGRVNSGNKREQRSKLEKTMSDPTTHHRLATEAAHIPVTVVGLDLDDNLRDVRFHRVLANPTNTKPLERQTSTQSDSSGMNRRGRTDQHRLSDPSLSDVAKAYHAFCNKDINTSPALAQMNALKTSHLLNLDQMQLRLTSPSPNPEGASFFPLTRSVLPPSPSRFADSRNRQETIFEFEAENDDIDGDEDEDDRQEQMETNVVDLRLNLDSEHDVSDRELPVRHHRVMFNIEESRISPLKESSDSGQGSSRSTVSHTSSMSNFTSSPSPQLDVDVAKNRLGIKMTPSATKPSEKVRLFQRAKARLPSLGRASPSVRQTTTRKTPSQKTSEDCISVLSMTSMSTHMMEGSPVKDEGISKNSPLRDEDLYKNSPFFDESGNLPYDPDSTLRAGSWSRPQLSGRHTNARRKISLEDNSGLLDSRKSSSTDLEGSLTHRGIPKVERLPSAHANKGNSVSKDTSHSNTGHLPSDTQEKSAAKQTVSLRNKMEDYSLHSSEKGQSTAVHSGFSSEHSKAAKVAPLTLKTSNSNAQNTPPGGNQEKKVSPIPLNTNKHLTGIASPRKDGVHGVSKTKGMDSPKGLQNIKKGALISPSKPVVRTLEVLPAAKVVSSGNGTPAKGMSSDKSSDSVMTTVQDAQNTNVEKSQKTNVEHSYKANEKQSTGTKAQRIEPQNKSQPVSNKKQSEQGCSVKSDSRTSVAAKAESNKATSTKDDGGNTAQKKGIVAKSQTQPKVLAPKPFTPARCGRGPVITKVKGKNDESHSQKSNPKPSNRRTNRDQVKDTESTKTAKVSSAKGKSAINVKKDSAADPSKGNTRKQQGKVTSSSNVNSEDKGGVKKQPTWKITCDDEDSSDSDFDDGREDRFVTDKPTDVKSKGKKKTGVGEKDVLSSTKTDQTESDLDSGDAEEVLEEVVFSGDEDGDETFSTKHKKGKGQSVVEPSKGKSLVPPSKGKSVTDPSKGKSVVDARKGKSTADAAKTIEKKESASKIGHRGVGKSISENTKNESSRKPGKIVPQNTATRDKKPLDKKFPENLSKQSNSEVDKSLGSNAKGSKAMSVPKVEVNREISQSKQHLKASSGFVGSTNKNLSPRTIGGTNPTLSPRTGGDTNKTVSPRTDNTSKPVNKSKMDQSTKAGVSGLQVHFPVKKSSVTSNTDNNPGKNTPRKNDAGLRHMPLDTTNSKILNLKVNNTQEKDKTKGTQKKVDTSPVEQTRRNLQADDTHPTNQINQYQNNNENGDQFSTIDQPAPDHIDPAVKVTTSEQNNGHHKVMDASSVQKGIGNVAPNSSPKKVPGISLLDPTGSKTKSQEKASIKDPMAPKQSPVIMDIVELFRTATSGSPSDISLEVLGRIKSGATSLKDPVRKLVKTGPRKTSAAPSAMQGKGKKKERVGSGGKGKGRIGSGGSKASESSKGGSRKTKKRAGKGKGKRRVKDADLTLVPDSEINTTAFVTGQGWSIKTTRNEDADVIIRQNSMEDSSSEDDLLGTPEKVDIPLSPHHSLKLDELTVMRSISIEEKKNIENLLSPLEMNAPKFIPDTMDTIKEFADSLKSTSSSEMSLLRQKGAEEPFQHRGEGVREGTCEVGEVEENNMKVDKEQGQDQEKGFLEQDGAIPGVRIRRSSLQSDGKPDVPTTEDSHSKFSLTGDLSNYDTNPELLKVFRLGDHFETPSPRDSHRNSLTSNADSEQMREHLTLILISQQDSGSDANDDSREKPKQKQTTAHRDDSSEKDMESTNAPHIETSLEKMEVQHVDAVLSNKDEMSSGKLILKESIKKKPPLPKKLQQNQIQPSKRKSPRRASEPATLPSNKQEGRSRRAQPASSNKRAKEVKSQVSPIKNCLPDKKFSPPTSTTSKRRGQSLGETPSDRTVQDKSKVLPAENAWEEEEGGNTSRSVKSEFTDIPELILTESEEEGEDEEDPMRQHVQTLTKKTLAEFNNTIANSQDGAKTSVIHTRPSSSATRHSVASPTPRLGENITSDRSDMAGSIIQRDGVGRTINAQGGDLEEGEFFDRSLALSEASSEVFRALGDTGESNMGSHVTSMSSSMVSSTERSHSTNTTHSESEGGTELLHWKKGNQLGKGAFGTVYCGLTNTGQLLAVKQVELSERDKNKAKKQYDKLQEEVQLLKTLHHKNIVGFLGVSLEDNLVNIFMQFIPGGSIASLLARFGALDETVFCRYTRQILEGTHYLHENDVIHRDIKGANIMLMSNGVIKLIDFGCAKRLCIQLSQSQSQSVLKSMRGTPYWMAPEVINETGHGKKSDVWSIGCTVFEMATRKPPWADMPPMAAIFAIGSGDRVPQMPDKFSTDAKSFVNACLTRDQKLRSTASELLQHPFIRRKKERSRERFQARISSSSMEDGPILFRERPISRDSSDSKRKPNYAPDDFR